MIKGLSFQHNILSRKEVNARHDITRAAFLEVSFKATFVPAFLLAILPWLYNHEFIDKVKIVGSMGTKDLSKDIKIILDLAYNWYLVKSAGKIHLSSWKTEPQSGIPSKYLLQAP